MDGTSFAPAKQPRNILNERYGMRTHGSAGEVPVHRGVWDLYMSVGGAGSGPCRRWEIAQTLAYCSRGGSEGVEIDGPDALQPFGAESSNADRRGRKLPGRYGRRNTSDSSGNEPLFPSICGVTLSVCRSWVELYGRQERTRSDSGILVQLDVVKAHQEIVRSIARQQGTTRLQML